MSEQSERYPEISSKRWVERPYRGRTSLAIPEALGLSNKTVLIIIGITALGAIGALAYLWYKNK